MRKHSDCYALARQWLINRAKLELKLLEGELPDEEIDQVVEEGIQGRSKLELAIVQSTPETLHDLAGVFDIALSIIDEGDPDDQRGRRMLQLVRDNMFVAERDPQRDSASPEACVAH